MNNKEKSPFTPGSPVPYELFVGRQKQIREIFRYVDQTSMGKQDNLFLMGDRGIGKSSMASFIRHFVATQKNFLGIHVFLGKVSTLEEMVRLIFEQLLKEVHGQTWFGNISELFGKYIKQIGLFGISIGFTPPKQDLEELVKRFPEALSNLLKKMKEQRKGLFIALDDINGLVEKVEFANWYKSFVDEVATHYNEFPVYMMLIGLPEKREMLSHLQPSLMRIFRIVEIDKLSNEEVGQFISQAFESVKMKISQEAMDLMVKFSSGLPVLMHEIGDAVFWIDSDGTVDREDALQGVLSAAKHVGEKYLDPQIYRVIQRSQRYNSILKKIGAPLSRNFVKKDIETRLNENERRVFHNFLRRFKKLGILETDIEHGSGAYRFVNEIYPIYIWMQSQEPKPS
ncbi:MAG: hypothetical protein FJ117_03965 [Deltaproteobacteria bacterium]|nr:hypothetical protein [Deltaproteobacteria bacterium]